MKIEYTNYFVKCFKKLSRDIQKKAIEQEAVFKTDQGDPRLHTKSLKGKLKGALRF